MKTHIEFRSDYEDDAEFSEEGDPAVPGGRNILEAYREWLGSRGIKASAVGPHSHYSMDLDVSVDEGEVWTMIQNPDPWLMITKPRGLRWPFMSRRRVEARHQAAIDLFTDFLKEDPKLHFVGASRRAEYERLPSTGRGGI